MGDETCDEQAVREETAQQGCRHQTALRQDREIASPRSPLIYLLEVRPLHLQRSPEGSNVEHFLEVGPFLEPRPLTSSELWIDKYELWADGLGQQDQPLETSRLQGRRDGGRARYPHLLGIDLW
jgi:hypothetical protein